MIILNYKGNKQLEFRLTKNPVSNPQQSPRPEGRSLDDLDPASANYVIEKERILKHPNYCENEMVLLKSGLNKFENHEHAEYLYSILGNPEEGGSIPIGAGDSIRIKNNNILLEVEEQEVEENGKKVKKMVETKEKLFKKYRMPQGVQIVKEGDPEQFKLHKE